MSTPRQRFIVFATGRRLSELVELLDVPRDDVGRLIASGGPPSRRLATAIERATRGMPGGPICVSDWPRLRGEPQ